MNSLLAANVKCGNTEVKGHVHVSYDKLGLGDMDEIKYHDILDQIHRYSYCNNVEMILNPFTKYLHYEIFDK